MQKVLSYADWQNLAELSVPTLRSDREQGTVATVKKVGFLAVDRKDCGGSDIPANGPNGKCLLPTAVLDGEADLRRLPPELGEWALNCVAMVRDGGLRFPCNVEFGRLDGRAYAEFI